MNTFSNITRPAGDPKILQSGPSSLGLPDRLGRALGWFSIGLGLVELLQPRRVTRALGVPGRERLVRLYGLRELGAGMMSLSLDKEIGLISRVGGDGLDILSLLLALRPSNPKAGNVGRALALVAGVTVLDVVAARTHGARHSREGGPVRDYSDRSGFPNGVEKARGAVASNAAQAA